MVHSVFVGGISLLSLSHDLKGSVTEKNRTTQLDQCRATGAPLPLTFEENFIFSMLPKTVEICDPKFCDFVAISKKGARPPNEKYFRVALKSRIAPIWSGLTKFARGVKSTLKSVI